MRNRRVRNPRILARRAMSLTMNGYCPFILGPMLLIGGYLAWGEMGLFALALAVPLVAVGASTFAAGLSAQPPGDPSLGGSEMVEAWLSDRLQDRARGTTGVAVMALNIDNVDALEERTGIALHDCILAELSRRLTIFLRTGDVVGHGVRSDFLVCLNDIKPPETENLLNLARRLQTALEEPFHHEAVRVYCTLSIGIVRARQLTQPAPRVLIRAAEAACASAAAEGPGAVRIYKSSEGAHPRSDAELANQLAPALENGEIVAWYQPQVSTETGDVVGFEALARWEHPRRGVISPATFLDLVEKSGLSQRLAEVVLTHALSALRTWDRAAFAIPSVAVNFAPEELRNPRLAEYVRWELDRFEIPPQRLAVEVLENVIAQSHDDIVARTLRAVADIGCRIDLDDFGTGYTSVLNIRRFSVSRIKIDRQLISRIDSDKDQRDMVAALLAMADRLGVETLGEGVETREEHALLSQMGCDFVQGFSIARPMPLGDTLAWVSEYRDRMASERPAPLTPTRRRLGSP